MVDQEFDIAEKFGLHVLKHASEVNEVVRFYLERGYLEELIDLLQAALMGW